MDLILPPLCFLYKYRGGSDIVVFLPGKITIHNHKVADKNEPHYDSYSLNFNGLVKLSIRK